MHQNHLTLQAKVQRATTRQDHLRLVTKECGAGKYVRTIRTFVLSHEDKAVLDGDFQTIADTLETARHRYERAMAKIARGEPLVLDQDDEIPTTADPMLGARLVHKRMSKQP